MLNASEYIKHWEAANNVQNVKNSAVKPSSYKNLLNTTTYKLFIIYYNRSSAVRPRVIMDHPVQVKYI